ncbi:hypothetical protein ACOMHN_056277 [Nucella lapillus]
MSSTESPLWHNSTFGEISAASVSGKSDGVLTVPEGCVSTEIFQFIPWDNQDNLVPKEADNLVNLLLLGMCLPVMFVVSFATNIVSMVVFYKHGLKERINACLFTLSLVDLLSVSVAFGYSSDVVYVYFIGKGGELGLTAQFFIRNRLMGLWGFVTASQMVYCVIAVERCLCITRPLLVKSFMPTKTTVVVLWVMIVLITGCFLFVAGVRYNVMCVLDLRDRSILHVNYPTDFYYRHQFVMDIMYSVVYGLFFPGLAFVCVTVSTVVTAVKLKKLSKWRESVSSASDAVTSRDEAITRVIVGTSVLFIICIIPAVVMRCSFLIVSNLKVGGRVTRTSRNAGQETARTRGSSILSQETSRTRGPSMLSHETSRIRGPSMLSQETSRTRGPSMLSQETSRTRGPSMLSQETSRTRGPSMLSQETSVYSEQLRTNPENGEHRTENGHIPKTF